MAQSFKLKVLTLITKLSDRDTYTLASTELQSIATSLDSTSLPTFLSCILSTDSSDKPLVRKQCLHLLSTIAEVHGGSISASLPKILTYITRRLRDSDSSVRANCVAAVSAFAAHVTRQPFSVAFLKPLSESVFTEQEGNAQVGSALCLAAAIDGAPDPEAGRLGRVLLPRVEKLLRSETYKAKSAALVVVSSVIGVGGVRGYGGGIEGLVKCLVSFLKNDDWAARKAAGEALWRLAVVERDDVAEFKAECLKVFESRRFDKVKAVREVMNQMIEAWKQVPDVSEEASPPPRSMASSKEKGNDGRYQSGSRNSRIASLGTPEMRKRGIFAGKTPDSSTSARMRGPLKSSEKKTGSSIFRKADCTKPSDWKAEVAVSKSSSLNGVCDNDHKENDVRDRRFSKLEAKRALFGRNSDDKMLKFGGKSGSRVAPCDQENSDSIKMVSNVSGNQHIKHKECEDLSSIRSQLVEIERQQSSLLDLLQKFIGTSQNGMRSLETRVHGLELALDEISYDLAVTSGRMTNANSRRTTCCLIPGVDFLSSKLWRKAEGRYSASRFSSHGATSDNRTNVQNLENRRLRLRGGHGLIVNPLAEIPTNTRQLSDVAQN